MRLLSFGGVTLPEVNANFQSPVGFRSGLVELRNGGFDQDGNDTYLESKIVSTSFWVSEAETLITNIDDYINDLYAVADNGRSRLLAVWRDGTVVSANAKLISARVDVDVNTWLPDSLNTENGYDRMSIAWQISYPYWLAVDDETKLLDDGWVADGSFDFGAGVETTQTFNSGSLSWSPTIANDGNARHERLTFIIEAKTGVSSVGDLNITNTTTGDTFEWTGTLVDGDIVTINTLVQTVLKNGSTDYANFTLPNAQVPFMTLNVGNNDFSFVWDSITGGDVDITVQYARHFTR